MTNRKLGNDFESELCEILFRRGFWVHNLAQNQAGQPADVMAVRNKVAYLIDCKVCSLKGFPLSRVEENQDSSMTLWKECGNGEGWFALKLAEDVYMIPHVAMKMFAEEKASMSVQDILEFGIPLGKWIAKCK